MMRALVLVAMVFVSSEATAGQPATGSASTKTRLQKVPVVGQALHRLRTRIVKGWRARKARLARERVADVTAGRLNFLEISGHLEVQRGVVTPEGTTVSLRKGGPGDRWTSVVLEPERWYNVGFTESSEGHRTVEVELMVSGGELHVRRLFQVSQAEDVGFAYVNVGPASSESPFVPVSGRFSGGRLTDTFSGAVERGKAFPVKMRDGREVLVQTTESGKISALITEERLPFAAELDTHQVAP